MLKGHELAFSIISSVLFGNKAPDLTDVNDECLEKTYNFCMRYDMCSIVAFGLFKNNLITNSELRQKYQTENLSAVSRYERINFELERAKNLLENNGIAYIPLKGSVIRKYYPEPYFRTSCDIDILIRRSDLKKAVYILEKQGKYKLKCRAAHDVLLVSESKTSLELHFTLINTDFDRLEKVLNRVWEYVVKVEGRNFEYALTDEMFYFYYVAHMAKHFTGGCGVRPFMDLSVLDSHLNINRNVLNSLLKEAGLIEFEKACRNLTGVWFNGLEHSELTKDMENFIFSAGVFGSLQNTVAVRQVKANGKRKYFFSRMFMPYDRLKKIYPSLEGKRFLLFFYQVRRWFYVIFHGRTKRTFREIKINNTLSEEQREKIIKMFGKLNLL